MTVQLTGPVEADDPWERETIQRDAILHGLEAGNAQADDVVLISDADEIPDRGAVLEARNLLIHQREQISFQQLLSFYHVDNVCTSTHWYGTQAVTYEGAKAITPERIRRCRGTSEILTPGGWHFCNLGDPDWLVEKIESFSHDEVNQPQYKDRDFLQACIDEGREMTGRPDLKFERQTSRHPYLPRYLIEHREKFAHLFSPAVRA